ncbi:hypothetical protein LCGC14_1826980 [marine sediment metagenome]|uniref:Uncharacterized protein n=1 Tax=marine sediment metagenome TaxID=412755 RepID=A0A0F9IWT3_9ZZZZ
MPRKKLTMNVFEAAIDRMVKVYEQGHRVVVSFSGGKDSGASLEVCILAAQATNRLPVDVICRDEEIMYPGTYEYVLRTAQRPEVNMHWIYACQPIINIFNRKAPYFWVFDPKLPPEQWVRQPPDIAYRVEEQNIEHMTIPKRFPVAKGKELFAVIGLRVSESRGRLYGLFSSKGYLTQPNKYGTRGCRPIYDWGDGDIWKAHNDMKWDYNDAYNTMHRLGVKRASLRIAPPTMNAASVDHLWVASTAWPQWFDRVCQRCPGVRTAAQFGKRSVLPERRLDETWEAAFHRLCIEESPDWIKERSTNLRDKILRGHRHHAATPFPDVTPCYTCKSNIGSWRAMSLAMYNGDPFSMKQDYLPFVEPELFRPGAGTWGGRPSFS